MTNSVISYPISVYQNVPIQAQYYQPSRFVISAVTTGATTLVTTSVNHNYIIGQQVRLLIPPTYGCRQLNGQQGYIISIPTQNQAEITINSSSGVNQFTSSSATTQPQILAIGDINSGIISSTGSVNSSTNVPGAFINISPI